MKMCKNKDMLKEFNFLPIIILFLTGCATLPNATMTQVSSVTTVPTAHSTSTTTPILTETSSPEPTIEPTWTLPATVPVDDSFSEINELFRTNGGCRLPCWWGITPGQTKWEDARNILFPFADNVADGQDKNGEFLAGLMTHYITSNGGTGFEQDYIIKNGIVQAIKIKLHHPIPGPKLKEMLSNYGIPDEVYLGGTYDQPSEGPPWQSFWLFLYYAKRRIFVEYSQGFEPPQPPNGFLSICFPESKIEYSELHIWGPEYSFEETLASIIQDYNPTRSLEDVTDLTDEELYKKFASSNDVPCIKTPAKNWLHSPAASPP